MLPFANMSGDAEQEYFSDGISEDIITDLSKVSALSVVARNTAFTYKGKSVKSRRSRASSTSAMSSKAACASRAAGCGSPRSLSTAPAGDHVWAERYDRDLNDIFALQDEISEAIVEALRMKLLPEEKEGHRAARHRQSEAYNLYLMARQTYTGGAEFDTRRNEAVIRLCKRATEIDPDYAQAWALMALGKLRVSEGRTGDTGLEAAERALALDPNLAEAHAVKARLLAERDNHDEALTEIAVALQLDPESYDVNRAARLSRLPAEAPRDDAIRYYEKALTLTETDINSAAMLMICYAAAGDAERRETVGAHRAPAARKRFWRRTRTTAWPSAIWPTRLRRLAKWTAPRNG